MFEVENVAKNLGLLVLDSKGNVSKLLSSLFSTLVIIRKLAFRFSCSVFSFVLFRFSIKDSAPFTYLQYA